MKNILSPREYEVMEKVSIGLLDKEIADFLDMKITTVKKHVQHIFQKFRVQNRTEATIKFLVITGKIITDTE
jgi:DNA-binding NarL/FixJ family response regulator